MNKETFKKYNIENVRDILSLIRYMLDNNHNIKYGPDIRVIENSQPCDLKYHTMDTLLFAMEGRKDLEIVCDGLIDDITTDYIFKYQIDGEIRELVFSLTDQIIEVHDVTNQKIILEIMLLPQENEYIVVYHGDHNVIKKIRHVYYNHKYITSGQTIYQSNEPIAKIPKMCKCSILAIYCACVEDKSLHNIGNSTLKNLYVVQSDHILYIEFYERTKSLMEKNNKYSAYILAGKDNHLNITVHGPGYDETYQMTQLLSDRKCILASEHDKFEIKTHYGAIPSFDIQVGKIQEQGVFVISEDAIQIKKLK